MSASAARTALVLQHDPTIPLGTVDPVLREHGYEPVVIDATADDLAAPDPASVALVVILGGEMGAYETEAHPFLLAERDLVRERMRTERPILGICLGAQVMATALGGAAYRGGHADVGFRRLELTETGQRSPLRHFGGVPVLEWHGDTFDLPEDAVLLASSDAYRNEAFAIGDWALAVQFHPEATASIVEHWIADGYNQLDELGIPADDLRAAAETHGPAMAAAMRAAVGEWLDGLGGVPDSEPRA